jgi:cytochrome c oxidase assembly protein subunit 11
MTEKDTKAANQRTTLKLVGAVIGMFAFAMVVMPPLYSLICDITGLNGKTSRMEQEQVLTAEVDKSRLVTVEFVASVAEGMPWEFRPMVTKMQVHPGELGKVSFYARNTTDHAMVGQAVPSLAPNVASRYFSKTECFCFTQQAFEPRQGMEMPVRFVIDPRLPKRVKTVTLSYTFFDTDKAGTRTSGTTVHKTGGAS